jgi:capsular polysaccharide biosynthesis protein/Mrp family chromosome partitioning ATPase
MSVARPVARALRRRSGTALAIFALTLGGALAVSRLSPTRYRATAEILLQQPDRVNAVLNPGAVTSAANVEREVNTNAQLITSNPVIDAVRARLQLTESTRELIDHVSVTGAATSNLVKIAVTDLRPRRAADVATAVAFEYQAYRRRSDQDAIGSAVEAARLRLLEMDDAARRTSEGRGLEARLHQLETDAAVTTGGVQVVRQAAVPSGPVPRIPPLAAAEILGLALALAALAAATLERLDRRLTDRRAVEDAFGHPVIGLIPAASRGRDPERVEAFDGVAARLRRSDPGPPGRIVLVTAGVPSPGDDAAIRLAEALAGFDPKVLLIEADLRHEATAIEGVAGEGGLTAVLCGESTLEDEVMLASYARAWNDSPGSRTWELLTAGAGASRPTAMLGSHEMRNLLAVARRRADVVVVAGPSLTAGADVLALAPLCDETIVVVRECATTRDDARRGREALEAASARVRGIILERGGRAQPWPASRQRRPARRMPLPFGRSRDVETPTPRVAARA